MSAVRRNTEKDLERLGLQDNGKKDGNGEGADPTLPGNPESKGLGQRFAERVGRTPLLWNPFLNTGRPIFDVSFTCFQIATSVLSISLFFI